MKYLTQAMCAALLCAAIVGCPAGFLQGDNSGIGTGDVSQVALNYSGTLTGSVAGSSSTATSTDPEAAQSAPLTGDAMAYLTGVNGNRLRDANGQEYPEFPINPDGTFEIPNLPVGADFIIVIDLDGDGVPDLFNIIHIPKDAGGDTGSLTGLYVDPLSTVTNARLQQMLNAQDIDFDNLDLSLAGIMSRTRDGYEHLLDDAGIEDEVAISGIAGLSNLELAQYFDDEIPLPAQRAMRMAASNIALAVATDVEGVVKATAQTLLEGGFVIADDPDGIDLSFLGSLPHVLTLTFEQFQEYLGTCGPGDGPPPGLPADFEQAACQTPNEPVIYITELVEADRNFAMAEEDHQPMMVKPMFSEYMLTELAELYLAGKTITLENLYHLFVDAESGLGVRLTYTTWSGDPTSPPVDVFESTDGTGIEKDIAALFAELDVLFGDPGFDPMAAQTASARQIIIDFLTGTAEPSFERIFGGFLMERVPGPEEFARIIRDKRAHIPFSRSGPSQWYVVATDDSWQNPNARAVTVDIETDAAGKVTKVTYNTNGIGKFYLGHGPMTENGMEIELIRRGNGRFLHDHEGYPQMLEMSDSTIFQPVNGESFFNAFSESGIHYPGAPALRVPNYEFDPSLPPDPATNPPDWEAFVLMTSPGPDGVPIQVNYAADVATYSETGMYYMLFDERSDTEGLFALMTENGEQLENPPGSGWENRVLVAANAVQEIDIAPEEFSFVYGIDIPNEGYDPEGAPYYDDINENGLPDVGEPTFAEQHFLWDPADWRSTWVEKYYRQANNNGFPDPEDIDWNSDTPKLLNGVALVPRNLRPRLNGFLFPRPNSAINLLMAFSPPEFFNGTQAIDGNTRINPLMAVAIVDLVFEQTMNVEAMVDWDGEGGMPPHEELVPAWFFVPPVDDPIALIAENFANYAE